MLESILAGFFMAFGVLLFLNVHDKLIAFWRHIKKALGPHERWS